MDPDPANLMFKLILLFILIFINAFFAMSEIAIITLNDLKLQKMADEGNKKAKKILKLTENPSNLLSSIQIGITLAGFLTSASAAENFATPVADFLSGLFNLTTTPGWMETVSLVVVTIIISFFSLVLGELVPKRIAMQKYESISFKIVDILVFIMMAFKPFIKILSFTTNIIVKIFGLNPDVNEETVTEEEIRMLVDAGEEKGVIEEVQKEMINNIFEFDDLIASDIMTHRTDMEAVEINAPIQDMIEIAIECGYSRIPVYEEDVDNIKGIVYIKDLLKYIGQTVPKSIKLSSLIRPAEFVPETKKCGELFSEMSNKHLQMVFVCDEYGGTSGLVTLEDLVESIVGSVQDEYDDEQDEIEQVDEKTYQVDGTINLKELEELLDIEFQEGEYDTIAGFLMDQLGRIPGDDESPEITYQNYRFTINEVDERRIKGVIVEKLPVEENCIEK